MSNPFLDTALPPPKPKVKAKSGPKPSSKIAERDKEIARRRASGEGSLESLGEIYGISRERIRQICDKQGVDNDAANDAYKRRKSDAAYDTAVEQAGSILMRYISGQTGIEIAHEMELQVKAVQEVLEEQITDKVSAARARVKTAARYPNATEGPKIVSEPRADRQWTAESVQEALIAYAKLHGNRLPSSTQYQKISPTDEALPSFPTVRNRLGRWSAVKADIHRIISQESATS